MFCPARRCTDYDGIEIGHQLDRGLNNHKPVGKIDLIPVQREQESKSPFVFVSERGTPFSTRGFQAMVERVARAAGFDMKIHPHMLRHSCGYKLAVRYTELAPTRFKSLFRD
jgi:site-specific recombinase XerD